MEKIQIITEIVRKMDAKTTVEFKEEGILFKKHFYLDELLELCETFKERCEGKEIQDENGNCIKPAVSISVCDEFENDFCIKCYPPFPECDECPHQPKEAN